MKKVILIGDSIRIGYQQTVQRELASVADVAWPAMNGHDSRRVLERLDDWAIAPQPDGIHINAGLHDIKRDRQAGACQVPLDEYAGNVERILRALLDRTRARVIWATMTPVNETWHHAKKPFDRYEADVSAYNQKACEVCRSLNVVVNDLYSLMMREGLRPYLSPDGVHFNEAGYELLGSHVARVIREHL